MTSRGFGIEPVTSSFGKKMPPQIAQRLLYQPEIGAEWGRSMLRVIARLG